MLATAKLPKSWPSSARGIVLEAARSYYREMKEPWAVPDVIMERVLEEVNKEISTRVREIYEEAPASWINRWESGKLDAEMKSTIANALSEKRR